MGYQPGLDAGVTGLLSMEVDGIGIVPAFDIRVFGWEHEGSSKVINRAGATAPLVRLGDWNGHVSFNGKVQLSAYPFPSQPKYATGTLLIVLQKDQFNTITHSISFSVKVTIQKFSRDEKTKDGWDTEGECICNGLPTIVWGGVQVVISTPAPNDAETTEGRTKIYDPNALVTRATQRIDCEGIAYTDAAEMTKLINYAASAVTPFSGGKVYTAEWVRTDTAGGYIHVRWALKDTIDDVLFPSITSSRAAIAPYRDSTAGLVPASGSVANQANSIWAGAQSQNFIENITVLSDPTPGWRKVVNRYINPGIGLRARATGPRFVMSRLNGTDSQVYIMDPATVGNKEYGSGMRLIQLDRLWVTDKPLRRFVLTRMIPGTTVPDAAPATIGGATLPAIGQINSTSGTFNAVMGVDAYTVSYNGAFVSTNLSLSGTRQFYMGYLFTQEPLGIVSNLPQRYFNSPQPIVTNYTASGWVSVGSLGLTGIVMPSSADFSAFITPYP